MDLNALFLSLKLALATTSVLVVVGLPLAYAVSRSRLRYSWLFEALTTLPIVLPPTVIGFYLLLALGPHGWVGQTYTGLEGRSLVFSFPGLLIGSVIYSLPFALQPFLTAFSSLNPALIEASWCLGVSPFKTWLRVVLPLSAAGIFSGCILSFAHTLGEFGIVMMIGGNIPGETRTLSLSIYDSVQALNYSSANRSSIFLLGVAFVVIALTSWLKSGKARETSS